MAIKRVGFSTTLTANATQSPKQTISLKGFNPDDIVRRLWIKISLSSLTRGGAGVAHEPEHMGQLVTNIGLRTPSTAPARFKPDIKGIDGWTFEQLYRLQNAVRNNQNNVFGAAQTTLEHWIEIPLVPNFVGDLLKAARPEGWWLENAQLEFTLTLAQFDTVNDITAATGIVEVLYQGETKPKGYSPAAGGIVLKENADFENVRKHFFTTFQPTMLFLKTRTAYSSLSLRSKGIDFYDNFTPSEIESLAPEHRYYLHNESRTAFQGDPMSIAVPQLVAGVSTPVNGLVAFDIRNMKDLSPPLEIEAFSKSAVIPFFSAGWQL